MNNTALADQLADRLTDITDAISVLNDAVTELVKSRDDILVAIGSIRMGLVILKQKPDVAT